MVAREAGGPPRSDRQQARINNLRSVLKFYGVAAAQADAAGAMPCLSDVAVAYGWD